MVYGFEKLTVWINAKECVKAVYELLRSFPPEEKYGLCDQLRRAVVSIPSNIAEGYGRPAIKEQIHFIHIAYGSLMEILCQIILAYELNYISDVQYKNIRLKLEEQDRLLQGYHRHLKSKLP